MKFFLLHHKLAFVCDFDILMIVTYDSKVDTELDFQLYFIEERRYALKYWSLRLSNQIQIKNII